MPRPRKPLSPVRQREAAGWAALGKWGEAADCSVDAVPWQWRDNAPHAGQLVKQSRGLKLANKMPREGSVRLTGIRLVLLVQGLAAIAMSKNVGRIK